MSDPRQSDSTQKASLDALLEAHLEAIAEQEELNRQRFEALRETARALVRGVQSESLPPPAAPKAIPVATPVAPPAAPEAEGWDQVLLGSPICNNPVLAEPSQALLRGLRAGESAAMGLVGSLLTFRSALPDKLPRLLSQIGEAYCRWRPAGSAADPMRDALIAWLEQICETRGVQNKVRVVQPGDRFDATRHNTKDRGVEVAEAFGWIVLRDNGKVYSKANVALR